jgi:alkylation response protein AidB-like acyl-CoA dehydrogenase
LTLFLVDRKTKGVKVTRTKMAGNRNAANIQFRGVTATPGQILGTLGASVLDRALDVAHRPAPSARLDGRVFRTMIKYLKEREQFGADRIVSKRSNIARRTCSAK